MIKNFLAIAIFVSAPLVLASPASTSSIRTPGGDVVKVGDSANTVTSRLGDPQSSFSAGYVADGNKMAQVFNWTYVLGKTEYIITIKGGVVDSITWDYVK